MDDEMHSFARTRRAVFECVKECGISAHEEGLGPGAYGGYVPFWCLILYLSLTALSTSNEPDRQLRDAETHLGEKYRRWLKLCQRRSDIRDAMWVLHRTFESDGAGGYGLIIHDFMEAHSR